MQERRGLGIRSGLPATSIKKDGITRANPDLEAIFETVYGGDAASLFEKLVRSRDIVVSEVADKHAVSHIPQKSLEYHL
jgi:hypothetical protein